MLLAGSFVMNLIVAALLGGGALPGQAVPAELQYQLFVKILTFDRSLDRMGEEIVIGVLYQPGHRASVQVKDELLAAVRASSVDRVEGRGIRVIAIALGAADVHEALRSSDVDAVYFTPLRAVDIPRLAASLGAAGLLTLSGVPEHARQGVAVGIGQRGGRPLILIDLPAARAAGSAFAAPLLRLAEVRQ